MIRVKTVDLYCLNDRPWYGTLVFFIALICFGTNTAFAATSEAIKEQLSADALLNDVAYLSKSHHVFDMHENILELRIGHYQVADKTLFSTQGNAFSALWIATWGGVEIGARALTLTDSNASLSLAGSPFFQHTRPSRVEAYIRLAALAIRGRGFSFLSPFIGDIEQSFSLLMGGNYPFDPYETSPVPKAAKLDNAKTPGIEVALRTQLYSRWGLGLFADFGYHLYFNNKIGSYYGIETGLSWAF